ncbi:MAG: DNA mismatch repair protein MutS, partial [Oscillospiraceae bacterium]
YKVAICEQTEDPSQATGIVKREVVRIVTPGTVIESELLTEEENNFIACVVCDKSGYGACFADVSTGKMFLSEQKAANVGNEIINEISKFSPSEILFNGEILKHKSVTEFIKFKLKCSVDVLEDNNFDFETCKKTVLTHFKKESLSSLCLEGMTVGVIALGALTEYLNQTQKAGAKRITAVDIYNKNEYMTIDVTARRNLEITKTMRLGEKRGTLLWILDKTKTAMGRRYMHQALEQPLISLQKITKRQAAVAQLVSANIVRSELQDELSKINDLERLMTRVVFNMAGPRELRALCTSAMHLPKIKKLISELNSNLIVEITRNIDELEDTKNLIENAIEEEPPAFVKDGGVIKRGFNKSLDEYRDLCNNAKKYITAIEDGEKEKTGIRNLKIGYNRVFGYYIEVTKSYLGLVPQEYIRKQTLANCERYITQELKELETKVITANEKIAALESQIFSEVRQFVADKIDIVENTAAAIATLDFLVSLAEVAVQNKYVCPTITVDGKIDIKDGRHPVVEAVLKDNLFVPNDTLLDKDKNRMLIITGPNMAGKSTYMRQVAVLTIMAQIGSFVPASQASISICDKIFTRVGASDDLAAGQSTFMVEMSEVANILKNATPNSLVILDEIGRGTSTFDGMSIAVAVVEYMSSNKKLMCKTMFATHYHELTELENLHDGVKNYNIAVKKHADDITFLRKIVRGGADESFGIEVAKLAGVPQEVVKRAKEILTGLENQSESKSVTNKTKADEQEQVSFRGANELVIEQALLDLQVDTLSPLEALNKLYELKKLAQSLQ